MYVLQKVQTIQKKQTFILTLPLSNPSNQFQLMTASSFKL